MDADAAGMAPASLLVGLLPAEAQRTLPENDGTGSRNCSRPAARPARAAPASQQVLPLPGLVRARLALGSARSTSETTTVTTMFSASAMIPV